MHHDVTGYCVLDLGCGEGKNASAFALAGATVDAVDCSARAIHNGKVAFGSRLIRWHIGDANRWRFADASYDVVIAYGLLHCLESPNEVSSVISKMKASTKKNGYNIVCTFNNRSHDLSAHPAFHPVLLSHNWYLSAYGDWTIEAATDADLHEVHPHNQIPHHHSMTRIMARKDG